MPSDGKSIRIRADGPYLVSGVDLMRLTPVRDAAGRPVDWREGSPLEHEPVYALCRCGASPNKPFCDGSHRYTGFDGSEVAELGAEGIAAAPELPPRIGIVDDGPLRVEGGIAIEGVGGKRYPARQRVALCRCGASKNKPFCDGSHTAVGFEDH